MSQRLHRLIYVHDGEPGALGAALEENGRLLHFSPESSGLLGIPVDPSAGGRTIPIRIEWKSTAELSTDLVPLVGDDVPCIVGLAGIEARVLVSASALRRSSPTITDLRGKIRYGLARAGWDLE